MSVHPSDTEHNLDIDGSVFLELALDKIEKRFHLSNTKTLFHLFSVWFTYNNIFKQRLSSYKEKYLKNSDKEAIDSYDHRCFILGLFTFDISYLLQASFLLAIIGYPGAAISILRLVIERVVQCIYFTIDPDQVFPFIKGKTRLPITGREGLLARLSDPKFIEAKTGYPISLLDPSLGKTLGSLFRIYSTAVHGELMQGIDLTKLKLKMDDKGIDIKAKHVYRYELDFLKKFSNTLTTLLDVLILSHISTYVILSEARVLTDLHDRESDLEATLSQFPKTWAFIKDL